MLRHPHKIHFFGLQGIVPIPNPLLPDCKSDSGIEGYNVHATLDAKTPPSNGQVPNEIRAQESFGLKFSLGFFTLLSKGATLSSLSDLGVSKERAEFLGTLLEKFHEAGDSVFELGLVREHFLTGKSLLVIVGTVIASPFDWMSSRGSSKRPDSVPGCSREDNRPRSGACFPEAIFSPVWRDRPPNDQR